MLIIAGEAVETLESESELKKWYNAERATCQPSAMQSPVYPPNGNRLDPTQGNNCSSSW